MLNGRALLSSALAVVCLALTGAAFHAQSQSSEDKYIWLEDVNSPRAMEWVKAENARSAKILEADPRFATWQEEALKVSADPNRLPMPDLRGNDVYNFWNDEKNVRGLLPQNHDRRLRQSESALADRPRHRCTRQGGKPELGFSRRVRCLYPGDEYCIFDLSVGGEDASTSREFDLKSGKFVDGGFVSPRSKQNATGRIKTPCWSGVTGAPAP